jgi:hypothetical protein
MPSSRDLSLVGQSSEALPVSWEIHKRRGSNSGSIDGPRREVEVEAESDGRKVTYREGR